MPEGLGRSRLDVIGDEERGERDLTNPSKRVKAGFWPKKSAAGSAPGVAEETAMSANSTYLFSCAPGVGGNQLFFGTPTVAMYLGADSPSVGALQTYKIVPFSFDV
jgi:hypothetical protein